MPGKFVENDVIVADNDSMIRDILRSAFERAGFNVFLAVDGIEAIDLAARTQARLVILDYKMPKLDGFAACEQIRQLEGYGEVPIVILTAFDDDTTRAAAGRARATQFFSKPFRPIELIRAVLPLIGAASLPNGADSDLPEALAVVWERQTEPLPVYGEPVELSKGRRVLNICR